MRSTSRFDILVGQDQIQGEEAKETRQGEISRLKKEIERLERDIATKERQLADQVFRSKAPEAVVQKLQASLRERKLEHFKLTARLEMLGLV
jgi:valyl-tRNA synthetase